MFNNYSNLHLKPLFRDVPATVPKPRVKKLTLHNLHIRYCSYGLQGAQQNTNLQILVKSSLTSGSVRN